MVVKSIEVAGEGCPAMVGIASFASRSLRGVSSSSYMVLSMRDSVDAGDSTRRNGAVL